MKQLSLVVGLIAAAALAVPVMAQDAKPTVAAKHADKMEAFKKADANADGKLSLDEFKTFAKNDAEKKFTAADTDKDGFVTPEELKAAHGKGPAGAAKAEKPAPEAAK
jgi:Ca2+-binding EF-hand superfamily protein